MIETVTLVCFILLSIAAVLAIVRFLIGPTVLDRVVGFDMVAVCIVGMIILLSVRWKDPVFIEIMLIFSLLGFVGTIGFVSYLHANSDRYRVPKNQKHPEDRKP